MKKLLLKEFCLWLVSPADGTVRKIRFSSSRILLVLVCLTFFAGGFIYVAGDYTRVQILRAQHYFSMRRLASERETLVHSNKNLRLRIIGLEQETKRAENFEKDIKKRLVELGSILESAAELGVLPEESTNSGHNAIGGAESECNLTANGKCSPGKGEESAAYTPSSFRADKSPEFLSLSEQGLIQKLKYYVDTLKVVPFGPPVQAHVTSYYGSRKSPFSGRISMHQGMDFGLPIGSSVYVTADGIVKNVKKNPTYGLVVDIQHSNNVVTRYAHLSKALVRPGQRIQRGDVIALVGTTGRSTGPHLHYEVRVKGRAVDPAKLVELSRTLVNLA